MLGSEHLQGISRSTGCRCRIRRLPAVNRFWRHRRRLARTLRIAWWSGHSHGRYAGSTWYSDTNAIDLARHGVAQVNCDSPGCRWATTFDHLTGRVGLADVSGVGFLAWVIWEMTEKHPIVDLGHFRSRNRR